MGFLAQELRNSVQGGGSLTNLSDFLYGVTGGATKAGIPVTEETALKYLAVFSCVSLISGDLGSLPLILYETGADGSKKRATSEPLYDILHNQPNRNTDSMHFRETGQNHLLTYGNFYSEIKRAPLSGEITELIQIPKPGIVQIKQNRKGIYYQWNDPKTGQTIRKTKKQIFHVAGWGMDGIKGMSVIALAREAISLGIAARDYGSLFFGQGTHPAGIFETDGVLGDNEQHLKTELNTEYAGLGKSHKAMLLQKGMKYKPIEIPMDDAQFLATREHQDLDICGMYKVPPHKIAIHGANSNNNNLEQENGSYVSQCLRTWFVRWEQAMNMQLLTPEQRARGLYTEILAEGLLRGDSAARSAYYDSMWSKGSMSANDINRIENRNPVEGGDQYFVPLNFIPSNQAASFAAPKIQEEKSFRSSKQIEKRSIEIRDRISKQYYPLFMAAAESIVNREAIAVKREVNKQSKERASTTMQSWLDEFYASFPAYIRQKIGPVIRSFSTAIQAASAGEMGIDVGITEDLERDIKDYIETYENRHTSSSLGQLTSLIEEGLDALTGRVDEWQETRPEKIADNETVRNSSYIYQSMAFSAGFSTVLRNRGPKTCPFCRSLAGKRVSRGGSPIVKDGQRLEGKDTDEPAMLIRGDKFHTPIHQKCDCYMSII